METALSNTSPWGQGLIKKAESIFGSVAGYKKFVPMHQGKLQWYSLEIALVRMVDHFSLSIPETVEKVLGPGHFDLFIYKLNRLLIGNIRRLH